MIKIYETTIQTNIQKLEKEKERFIKNSYKHTINMGINIKITIFYNG